MDQNWYIDEDMNSEQLGKFSSVKQQAKIHSVRKKMPKIIVVPFCPDTVHMQMSEGLLFDSSCSFRVMRADRQTNKLITILCTPPGGEVTRSDEMI